MRQTMKHSLRYLSFSICLLAVGMFLYGSGCGKTVKSGSDASTNKNNSGCQSNDDCEPGTICQAGECAKPKEEGCKRDGDCKAGEVCIKATKKCEAEKIDPKVDSVKIVTTPSALREGATLKLEAVAYNKQGAILADVKFAWKSEQEDVVKVDVEGVAIGGSKDGNASIMATADGKTSAPITIHNFGKVEDENARVVVYDSEGKAVEGATVLFGDQTSKTDAQGQAMVKVKPPFTLHIFHAGHAYFSAYNISKTDLFVQLSSNVDLSKAGGVRGTFDFGRMRALLDLDEEEWSNSNVGLGFAGLSIPGNLIDLNFETLLGESLEVTLLGYNPKLPSGVVVDINNSGKNTFEASGVTGNRVLWGLAGRFQISELQPIISSLNGEGDINIGSILEQIQPLLTKFAGGIAPNQQVTLVNKVKDKDDKNVNGKTDDLIADFAKFRELADGLLLTKKLDQSLKVSVKSVPSIEYKNEKGEVKQAEFYLISLAGVRLPGFGVVPIGFAVEKAKQNSTLELKYIKPYKELTNGEFLVLTLCLTIPIGSDPPPALIAANITFMDAPGDINVDSFVTFGRQGKFDAAARKITNARVAGGNMQMLTLSNEGKRWFVIYGENEEIVLPKPPGDDRATDKFGVTLFGIKLKHSLDELLEFNKTNMNELVKYVEGFSSYEIHKGKEK